MRSQGYRILLSLKLAIIRSTPFTSTTEDPARDPDCEGVIERKAPRLISNTNTHPNMDAEAQQAKFAIHQACREGQSRFESRSTCR